MSLELLWNSSAAGEDSLITTQLPGQFSDQVKEVSARLMQLLDSETMEQHQMAVANFSKVGTVHLVISSNVTHITQDIVVTTRWSKVVGRDAVRVGFYRFKYFASVEAQPILAEVPCCTACTHGSNAMATPSQVNTSDPAALTILYLMQITLLPKRTWINPIGFLLPYRLPCTAIIKVVCWVNARLLFSCDADHMWCICSPPCVTHHCR